MKLKISAFCVLAALGLFAEEPAPTLGAPTLGSRLVTVESSNVTTKAWTRSGVSVDPFGNLHGDCGVVGEKASTEAIDVVAARAVEISDAATQAINTSMDYLHSKTNNMATNCIAIAIHIAPETVRSNLTGYVVKTLTVGNIDRQWVWYNRQLGLRPNRYVRYSYFGGTADVKAEWVNWTTNGVSVTVDGQTWEGCHECTVERPVFARGRSCLDLPNEVWGGANGIDFGDMAIRVKGVLAYTGYVTNSISGQVLFFDNGFQKDIPNE